MHKNGNNNIELNNDNNIKLNVNNNLELNDNQNVEFNDIYIKIIKINVMGNKISWMRWKI